MLKFKTQAEFERWFAALPPAQQRRIPVAPRERPTPVVARPSASVAARPSAQRAARKPRLRARAASAAAWFFVGVVGVSSWGITACVAALAGRTLS